jgi:site-specific recombinase XerC
MRHPVAKSQGSNNLAMPSGNLRAVQLLLGQTKMDSTVRYLGVELEDVLAIAEGIEI